VLLGHFGVGLAAKRVAPQAPLWSLLVASQVPDLLSFGFAALGLERFGISHTDLQHGVQVEVLGSVPWSHSLLMSIVWSLLVGGVAYLISRNVRLGGVLGGVVFSHWLLDWIVHPPDLPLLLDNSPQVGLGLWCSGLGLVVSMVLEVALFVGGIAVYLVYRRSGAGKTQGDGA
jgi:membrane-bound metal-dependent hydrolase YbcI (DUF457 family)